MVTWHMRFIEWNPENVPKPFSINWYNECHLNQNNYYCHHHVIMEMTMTFANTICFPYSIFPRSCCKNRKLSPIRLRLTDPVRQVVSVEPVWRVPVPVASWWFPPYSWHWWLLLHESSPHPQAVHAGTLTQPHAVPTHMGGPPHKCNGWIHQD